MISCTVDMPSLYTHTYNSVNTHMRNSLVHSRAMNTQETVKALIERRKEQTGESLTAQAKGMGLTQATLYRIVSGETQNPSHAKLKAIARYFRCSIDDLESGAAILSNAGGASGTNLPGGTMTNVPCLSPPPGTHEASSGAISSTAPAITYEVVKGAVAGVLQALGVRYEDLVEDDSTARQRIEAALGIAEPGRPADKLSDAEVLERLAKIGGEMIYDGKRVIPRQRGESGRKKKPA